MTLKSWLFIFMVFLVSSCSLSTKIPVCNPEEGRFIDGKHYVSGNLLTEDDTWDLLAFQHYYSKREKLYPDSSCIPISQPSSFEETLYGILEDIDFK